MTERAKPGPRPRLLPVACPACDKFVFGLGQHFRHQHGMSYAAWLVENEPRHCLTCSALILPDPRIEADAYRSRLHCGVQCQGKYQTGRQHPNYKGGCIDDKGYRMVYVNGRRIQEHRAVMEAALRRRLETREHVHHINGDKLDNRLENLEVLDIREHSRLHHYLKHQ